MCTVEICGWQPGFRKVAMTRLVQCYGAYSLREAKAYTDRVLHGETVLFTIADAKTAQAFATKLEAIGAIVTTTVR